MIPRPGTLRRIVIDKITPRKMVLESNEIKAVLAHYDLGQCQVRRHLGGSSSHNLLLDTNRGHQVLKKYFWSLASTMQEHSILGHLAKSGFPTPQLVRNRKELTFTELGDQHYAIYDFVDGYRYTDYYMPLRAKQRLAAQAGEVLAQFHQSMIGFCPAGRKVNGFRPDGETLWRDVEWHLGVLDEYVEAAGKKTPLDGGDAFLLSVAAELRDDLVKVGRYFEQPGAELPKLVIHGDYAPHNILFDRGKLVMVLDFGDACVNLRGLDIARGVTSFARAYSNRRSPFGLNESLAHAFLQAYQAQQPLSDAEIGAIPDLMRWRLLQPMIWRLHKSRSGQEGSGTGLLSLRRNWNAARWLKAHGSELQASLLSLDCAGGSRSMGEN